MTRRDMTFLYLFEWQCDKKLNKPFHWPPFLKNIKFIFSGRFSYFFIFFFLHLNFFRIFMRIICIFLLCHKNMSFLSFCCCSIMSIITIIRAYVLFYIIYDLFFTIVPMFLHKYFFSYHFDYHYHHQSDNKIAVIV